MKDRKTMRNKIQEHKKELMIGGAVALTVVGTVVLMKNWDAIVSILPKGHDCPELKDTLTEPINQTCPDMMDLIPPEYRLENVRHHLRLLPEGQHASQDAIDSAAEWDIILEEGWTFVKDHTRSRAA